MNNENESMDLGPVIYTYTRSQAMADSQTTLVTLWLLSKLRLVKVTKGTEAHERAVCWNAMSVKTA
jgi:hypothetical protein